ncbi:hypothetical protein V1477_008593 [Vespula maculifrons]|uniref:Uncharacterized protein n=1 Tax=Vespula maculifrons TaxID=7453 RepID=A0ABD2CDW3_VESMC
MMQFSCAKRIVWPALQYFQEFRARIAEHRSFQEFYVPTDETSRLSFSTYTLSFVLCTSSNKRRIILFIITGQDAHHIKNQQTFRSNKKRIILFIILGQDAHPASINEDFKTSLQPCVKQ